MPFDDLQKMLDYFSYKQDIKNSKATKEQIDELIKDAKSGWWEKNKHRFPGLFEENESN